MVLSSNASIMESTLGPIKSFIQESHLACGDTRQLSAVDGTHLRGRRKKKGWCGGQAFPLLRLRENCLAQESHEGKRTPPGG